MKNDFSIPAHVLKAIRQSGYGIDTSMTESIVDWWQWYTARSDWYDKQETINNRKFKIRRHTLHPARRVCREWASAVLDDDGTKFTVETGQNSDFLLDGKSLDIWLKNWIMETRFIPNTQRCLERAFATGTGAITLWFDVLRDETRILPLRYDARMILPLSWDESRISECAFVTRAFLKGLPVDQLQMHVKSKDTGTYHIITKVFSAKDAKEIQIDNIISDFDTMTASPTFAIIRPALDNVYVDGTYMGQSIFADAIDAIKGVDNAFDSMQREIDATKVKVFMSDDLFDVDPTKEGRARAIPMSPENTYIRKVAGNGMQQMFEVFSPEIRMAPLVASLNAALAELGDLTGFGPNYLRFDKNGGLRTATEVASDHSVFLRNIKKHENELKPQLEGILERAIECYCLLNNNVFPTGIHVNVDFDDSIITDTQSEKAQAMAEVAAGLMLPWEYRVRFFGEDAATAQVNALAAAAAFGVGESASSQLNGSQAHALIAVMTQFQSGGITEGQAINLLSSAMGVDKTSAKKILDGDITDMLTSPPVSLGTME